MSSRVLRQNDGGMELQAKAPRKYRGATPDERRAARREQLMEAGLELFGTTGYTGTSVRAVSAAASLNSRYFYESFASREDLLYSVYQRIMEEIAVSALQAVADAETLEDQTREGLRAGWTILTEDRRKARIVALEVVGVSDRLEQLRRRSRQALAQLAIDNATSYLTDDVRLVLDPALVGRAMMGSLVELLVAWIHGDIDASVDEVVDHLTRLFLAAAYASVETVR
jgi:AcrR family transcriptional regulator